MGALHPHKPVVAVIGGGISGLSVAFWLLQHDTEVIVLEQTDRPGGLIKSYRSSGYLADYAANCLLNYLPEVNKLCDEVGVGREKVYRSDAAKNRYLLLKDGHPSPLPRGLLQFVRTDLWSVRGKLRLLAEPLIRRDKSGDDETISHFIRRRFGKETLEHIVEPFVGGSYAGDPEQLSLKSTFPVLHALEQQYRSLTAGALIKRMRGSRANCPMHLFSFRDGMETLPKAISMYMGDRFSPDTRVVDVKVNGKHGYSIEAENKGRHIIYNADAVCIAAPAYDAAKLLCRIAPDVSGILGRVGYSPVAVVYTGFARDKVRHPLDGIGCMVPSKHGGFILGTLWNSSLFSNRAPDGMVAITNYLGGKRHPEALERTNYELLDVTMNDLKKIIGISGPPDYVHIVRHQRALPQFSLGHKDIAIKLDDLQNRMPGLFITGNYLSGISVRDCISYGKRLAGRIAKGFSDERLFG